MKPTKSNNVAPRHQTKIENTECISDNTNITECDFGEILNLQLILVDYAGRKSGKSAPNVASRRQYQRHVSDGGHHENNCVCLFTHGRHHNLVGKYSAVIVGCYRYIPSSFRQPI